MKTRHFSSNTVASITRSVLGCSSRASWVQLFSWCYPPKVDPLFPTSSSLGPPFFTLLSSRSLGIPAMPDLELKFITIHYNFLLQDYLARKPYPPLGATVVPHVWSYCRAPGGAVSYVRGTPVHKQRPRLQGYLAHKPYPPP
jgi:hypothetical protein